MRYIGYRYSRWSGTIICITSCYCLSLQKKNSLQDLLHFCKKVKKQELSRRNIYPLVSFAKQKLKERDTCIGIIGCYCVELS